MGLEMGSDVLEAAVGAPVPELLASHTPSSWSSCFQKYEVSSFRFWCEGFPCGSAGKESACNAGDLGSIPGLERSPGEGEGYPLQCSGLENSMDRIVPGVAKSQTQLSDFHFHFGVCTIVWFLLASLPPSHLPIGLPLPHPSIHLPTPHPSTCPSTHPSIHSTVSVSRA